MGEECFVLDNWHPVKIGVCLDCWPKRRMVVPMDSKFFGHLCVKKGQNLAIGSNGRFVPAAAHAFHSFWQLTNFAWIKSFPRGNRKVKYGEERVERSSAHLNFINSENKSSEIGPGFCVVGKGMPSE